MQRHIRAFAQTAAGLCLLAVSHAAGNAQTVMGAGTPANCVQNAGNGELACGSGHRRHRHRHRGQSHR